MLVWYGMVCCGLVGGWMYLYIFHLFVHSYFLYFLICSSIFLYFLSYSSLSLSKSGVQKCSSIRDTPVLRNWDGACRRCRLQEPAVPRLRGQACCTVIQRRGRLLTDPTTKGLVQFLEVLWTGCLSDI